LEEAEGKKLRTEGRRKEPLEVGMKN